MDIFHRKDEHFGGFQKIIRENDVCILNLTTSYSVYGLNFGFLKRFEVRKGEKSIKMAKLLGLPGCLTRPIAHGTR